MPLNVYKRPSGIYHIRGKHHGRSIDQSARTRIKSVADSIAEKLERQIFDEEVLGKKPARTFAEAAVGYMESGGERPLLKRILACPIVIEGERCAFGALKLPLIDQSVINQVAAALYPNDVKQSTITRRVITPICYVLNYAAEQPTWNYAGFRIRRPTQPKGRIDWRMPEEIEWWLKRAAHVTPLLTSYVGTGARASELVFLDWINVSPAGHRFTLWEDETKASTARSVDLQRRVRDVLPDRGHGAVWRNLAGEPWHDYDAINLHLYKITEREVERAVGADERDAIKTLRSATRSWKRTTEEQAQARTALRDLIERRRVEKRIPKLHLHVLRHTWATWAYAVTKDITFVMGQGGWASEKIALRYIHGATRDLAAHVLDHGWEMDPGTAPEPRQNEAPSDLPTAASSS